jgi:hypothetical protein
MFRKLVEQEQINVRLQEQNNSLMALSTDQEKALQQMINTMKVEEVL